MSFYLEYSDPVWIDELPEYQRFNLPFPTVQAALLAAPLVPELASGFWQIIGEDGTIAALSPKLQLWQTGCDTNRNSAPKLAAEFDKLRQQAERASFSFGDYQVKFIVFAHGEVDWNSPSEFRYIVSQHPDSARALPWNSVISKSGARLSANFERNFGHACAAWEAIPRKDRPAPYHLKLIDQLLELGHPLADAFEHHKTIKLQLRLAIGDERFLAAGCYASRELLPVSFRCRYDEDSACQQQALAVLAKMTPAKEPRAALHSHLRDSRLDGRYALELLELAGVDDIAAARLYHEDELAKCLHNEAANGDEQRPHALYDNGGGAVTTRPKTLSGLPGMAAAHQLFALAGIDRYQLMDNAEGYGEDDLLSPGLQTALAAEAQVNGSIGQRYSDISAAFARLRSEKLSVGPADITFVGGSIFWRGEFSVTMPQASISLDGQTYLCELDEICQMTDGSRQFRELAHTLMGKAARELSWTIFTAIRARFNALKEEIEPLVLGFSLSSELYRIAGLVAAIMSTVPAVTCDGHAPGCDGDSDIIEFIRVRMGDKIRKTPLDRALYAVDCDCQLLREHGFLPKEAQ